MRFVWGVNDFFFGSLPAQKSINPSLLPVLRQTQRHHIHPFSDSTSSSRLAPLLYCRNQALILYLSHATCMTRIVRFDPTCITDLSLDYTIIEPKSVNTMCMCYVLYISMLDLAERSDMYPFFGSLLNLKHAVPSLWPAIVNLTAVKGDTLTYICNDSAGRFDCISLDPLFTTFPYLFLLMWLRGRLLW